jgi:hypothetical protein
MVEQLPSKYMRLASNKKTKIKQNRYECKTVTYVFVGEPLEEGGQKERVYMYA